jgi:hypothetical protein
MHFTTLFLLKGEKLEDLSKNEIEDIFCDRFCYCCGETRPMYDYWCDWFQIGGRWCDLLVAKTGIRCDRGYPNEGEPIVDKHFSIVEIKDLEEDINENCIYAIATKSRIYQNSNEWGGNNVDKDKFHKLLNDINNKKINGVIALIDCHD